MISDARTLLVGVGSPHGDDCVGWLVARRVQELAGGAPPARCARTPAELLDWLDGLDTLIVCDAVAGAWPVGQWRRWTWPNREIAEAPFCGSHDLPLPAVLALASELGRLPPRVEVWAVAIAQANMMAEPTAAVAAMADVVAQEICGALCHA